MSKPSAILAPFLTILATVALAAVMAETVSAQEQTTIRLDHSTGTLRLQHDGRVQEIQQGGSIRIPSGRRVAVVVENSNSALYACKATQEPIAVPAMDTLKTFTGKLGDYLPLVTAGAVGLMGRDGPRDADDGRIAAVRDAASALQTHLGTLDELVQGPAGMKMAHLRVRATLAEMRLTPGEVDSEITSALREWLDARERCRDDDCAHLSYPEASLRLVAAILESQRELAAAVRAAEADVALPASLQKMVEALNTAADKVRDDEGDLVREALALESVAVRTHRATAEVVCDTVQVSWDAGRALTLNVSAHPEPEVNAVATRAAMERKADVHPNWLVRPSLGLTFLAAPGAEYTTYRTRTVDQGVQIVEGDVTDHRFTYGLTLAVTYRGVDGRRSHGWALWLPELTINPTANVRAIGIGGGVSYRMLKVGTGLLFTRHAVLNGQTPGQILESAEDVRTRETFGGGRLYFGISMMGLPPFIATSN